ncbi:MAG: lamin tail domain-containing protein, partial [Verrucomicrobiia bacterium]
MIDKITYGPQSEGVSGGRLPDGAGAIVAFPGSASPGSTNYVISWSGPVFNEILARNRRGVVSPWGDYAGYIELFNPAGSEVDLTGFSLAASASSLERWFFPQGSVMQPGGYLCVWCSGAKPPGANGPQVLNTGFELNAQEGEIGLFDRAGQLVDAVRYGFQVTDMPIGRSGGNWQLMAGPSPGADNGAPAQLGAITALRINEWMAAGDDDSDWVEVYNTAGFPIELSGLFLTDDPSIAGRTKSRIAALSFVGPHDWVCFVADANPSAGPDHVHFSLDRLGETVRIYGPDLTLIDAVDFGLQAKGVSEGRLPDGAERFASFPGTPSPGASNYLLLPEVVINEVLSNPDEPFEDVIELYNPTELPVNIGGWYLSNSANDPIRYRIPDGTLIPPHGYRVFYQCQFGPVFGDDDQPPKFTLNGVHGDSVYLSETDEGGNLTGQRAAVTFGASAKGVSFGRYTTSVGVDFVSLRHPTFGADNATTVEQFRTGNGAENASPLVGPIVISEIMYHPPADSSIADAAVYEFIEVHNIASTNVPLYDLARPTNVWRIATAVRFDFPAGTVMAPGARVVVVPFDPVVDVNALAQFKARYGSAPITIFGPYIGKLDNAGDVIELLRPDSAVQPPAPDGGFVPYVLVDRVCYDDASPWPTAADGGGASLQRVESGDYGNDPLNWKAEAPTPGRPNNSASDFPPVIVAGPQDLTVNLGDSAEFVVQAEGT